MRGGFGQKGFVVVPHVSGTNSAGEVAAAGEGADGVRIGATSTWPQIQIAKVLCVRAIAAHD